MASPIVGATYDCVTVILKKPGSAVRQLLDWSAWLETGDAISSSSWSASTGLTVSAVTFTGTTTTGAISGGMYNEEYYVRNTITTQAGRTEVRTLLVRMHQCSTTTTTTTTTTTSTTTGTTTTTTTSSTSTSTTTETTATT